MTGVNTLLCWCILYVFNVADTYQMEPLDLISDVEVRALERSTSNFYWLDVVERILYK